MIVLREIDTGTEYSFEPPCLIGRGAEADLPLTDRTISRRHALIDLTDKLWIKNLKNANGVWVNGKRITGKTYLHPGDSIQIGKMRFLLPQPGEERDERTVILHAMDRSVTTHKPDRQRLELIYAITSEFPGSQDMAQLGEKIFARFSDYFKQDHGYIALFSEDGQLQPLCCNPPVEKLSLSSTIINRVVEEGQSLLLEDALSSDAFNKEESIIALRIRSAMCAPLIYHKRINGLIYMDRNVPGAYSHSDLELLQSIAAIIAPLIENTRLWTELKTEYSNTVERLREAEARLIDSERVAACVRLSQAMAHEVRNPLTALGGLVRRIARLEPESIGVQKLQTILRSVERIEMVLKEVDDFSHLPMPQKKMARLDSLVQEVLRNHQADWRQKQIVPEFSVATSQVMVPVDASLIKKALDMVIKEILLGIGKGGVLPVTIRDADEGVEICFGSADVGFKFRDPFSPAFLDRPWCNSLFFNIAHKILLDHGGKLMLNECGQGLLPLVLRLSRSLTVTDEFQENARR